MTINDRGLAIIKAFEGCRLDAYQDVVGIWTIGFGSTEGVTPGMHISPEEAEQRLLSHLRVLMGEITDIVPDDTTENQFSALVCLAYNIGIGNLRSSTLIRKLRSGDTQGAADEFLRWDKAGGKVVTGLLRRREAERELFLSA